MSTSGPTVEAALGLLRPYFEKSNQGQVFEPYTLKGVSPQVFARLSDLAEEADTGEDGALINRQYRQWKNFK